MNLHSKLSRSMLLKMFFVLLLINSSAMAADDAPGDKVACVAGTQGCEAVVHPSHLRRGECSQDSQDPQDPQACDTRKKSMRAQADITSRDRHACRD